MLLEFSFLVSLTLGYNISFRLRAYQLLSKMSCASIAFMSRKKGLHFKVAKVEIFMVLSKKNLCEQIFRSDLRFNSGKFYTRLFEKSPLALVNR